jgi:hypothetical protein
VHCLPFCLSFVPVPPPVHFFHFPVTRCNSRIKKNVILNLNPPFPLFSFCDVAFLRHGNHPDQLIPLQDQSSWRAIVSSYCNSCCCHCPAFHPCKVTLPNNARARSRTRTRLVVGTKHPIVRACCSPKTTVFLGRFDPAATQIILFRVRISFEQNGSATSVQAIWSESKHWTRSIVHS